MKKVFALSIISLVVVACSKGPVPTVKSAAPAQLGQGWDLAESSDKTVSLGIAPGWKRGGANSMNMMEFATSGMGTEGMTQEALAQLEQEQQKNDAEVAAELEKKGIVISCIDSSKPIPGEERTRYTVKREKKGPMTLEAAAEAAKEDLIDEKGPTMVDLPIGKAARFDSKSTLRDGGVVTKVVYILCNGDDVYTVSFITENDANSILQVVDPVIQTLRIKPAGA
ncbi:MAG: hypothetical protein BGO01_15385 [Armatimonadetes bacterium 55-13]|nr:hypothetical protein [Armatimonadota bacterium]OJU65247.1 MAG: hypothetical protein BGO01_15385 [Armatimonadetes bacterium 55-13]